MFQQFQSIHFVGICGTAMAAVAAAFQDRGVRVTGSDCNVYPPMSVFLAERGIKVREGYREANLADSPELVVIGNSISRGNPEAEAVLKRKLHYCALPELLKEVFIRGKRSIVVSGTHGKTTAASLLTWVLEHNGFNPSYLIGGIPNNFSQGARFTDSEWIVLEGDEYDTAFFDKRSKFVHYLPEVALINNLEFDHADIFDDLSQIQTSFSRMINLIPSNGLLVVNGDEKNIAPLLDEVHCPIKRFSFNEVDEVSYQGDGVKFKFNKFQFQLPLYGEYNVRNALGVIAIARYCGLSDGLIQDGFDTFTGVKRRMEIRGEVEGVTVIDDFAHHPTAIRETLRAVRARFPQRRIWAVFEPRSNTTRRNIFQNELAESLGQADRVVISSVVQSSQIPEPDLLNPEELVQNLSAAGMTAVYLPTTEAVIDHVLKHVEAGDVICVLSNGGFENLHERLIDRLKA